MLAGVAPPAPGAETTADPAETQRRLKALEDEAGEVRRRGAALAAERRRAEAEIASLGERSAAIAERIRAAEAEGLSLDREISKLAAAEAETLERLTASRGATSRALGAMQQLSRRPTEALLVAPGPPADTVRTAVLLRAVAPALNAQASRLGESLALLSSTRRRKAADLAQLASVERRLNAERVELAALTTEKNALFDMLSADMRAARSQALALAHDARDLRELMARIEADRKARAEAERKAREETERQAREDADRTHKAEQARPAVPPPQAARGLFSMPADGQILGQYGETLGTGQSRKGLEIEVRSGGQVVAPAAGQVVFAGLFRGYGQLLIIEHMGGYHTLLAGLGRIDCSLGHTLVTGEPVGVMASEIATPPILYLEIRRDGQPVNPLSWLAARKRNGNG